MDLSRRDAFRPCSRDSLGDKSQFCFISLKKTKKQLINWIRPPLPFLGYTFSSAIWLTPKLFAYNLPTTITQYATNSLLETFKIHRWQNPPPVTEIPQAKPTHS